MKKVIRKKEYDSETAIVVKKYTYGCYGESVGYEEILFQTEAGSYFIYTRGGDASAYPGEDIRSLAKANVKIWLKSHQ